MPELPEVETVRLGLAKLLPKKIVKDVWHDWPKSFPNSAFDTAKFLIGATVDSVERRAKVLIINLSSGYSLVIHLKMTGQLVFRGKSKFGAGHPSRSLVGELPDKSTRVVIDFTDGSKLFFNDQRKFGWIRLLPTSQVPEIDFMKKVGPEPLEDSFTSAEFIKRLERRKGSCIKAALIDQSVIAGVGNIYADESLWAAKIHPSTLVSKLSHRQMATLLGELKNILTLAINAGGSTDRNYVDARGRKGSYLSFAKVFRREGQPCEICGTTIEKIRVAGRGTHICPYCQKQVK